MQPRITLVTLGVDDPAASVRFFQSSNGGTPTPTSDAAHRSLGLP
jgi:hypothetical protein